MAYGRRQGNTPLYRYNDRDIGIARIVSRSLRAQLNVSQREWGKKLGYHVTLINALECGRKAPSTLVHDILTYEEKHMGRKRPAALPPDPDKHTAKIEDII